MQRGNPNKARPAMPIADLAFETDRFVFSLAQGAEDLRAAQALRYAVFVEELGGQGAGVDHAARIEHDAFDAVCDHLMLRERASGAVIGVYRVLPGARASDGPGFYSAAEYDLTPLQTSGRRLLELGRSCVRADHRSGTAMFHLWTGLARYVAATGAEVLFGVASLKGTDAAAHAPALSLLHHAHRAPRDLRPRATRYQRMDLIAEADLDRRAAMVALPSLIKSYLRLGGMVGDGAFVDRAFNCIDVCMILDTARLAAGHADRLTAGRIRAGGAQPGRLAPQWAEAEQASHPKASHPKASHPKARHS